MNKFYKATVHIVNPRCVSVGSAMHRSPKRAIQLAATEANRQQEKLPIHEYNVGMEWVWLQKGDQTLLSSSVNTGWDHDAKSYCIYNVTGGW